MCAGLARLLSRRQRSVFLCKPLLLTDGTEQKSGLDAAFFARLTGVPQPESWPLPMSAAEARQGLSPSIREGIAASLSQAAEAREVIMEGPPATATHVQPLPLAADLAEALDARVLAVGTPEVFCDMLFDTNRDFLLNSFNWAADREFRVSISTRDPERRVLRLGEGDELLWINRVAVFGLPLLCLLLGLVRWSMRRAI